MAAGGTTFESALRSTSGDGSVTICATAIAATTALTSQASPSVPVGGSISDQATVAGGASPTGTITFELFGPADPTCAGPALATSSAAVSGNGSYDSAPFVAALPGTYRWVVSYSGDANNLPAGPTACGEPTETVVVTAPLNAAAIPTIGPGGLIALALLIGGAGALAVRRLS